jgi:hypothetical protein
MVYIAPFLYFLVLFCVSVFPAAARHSRRSHGEINAVLKHKRAPSTVNNRTVFGDVADLEKRDQTKYVFMHHVRWPICIALAEVDFFFVSADCRKYVLVYLFDSRESLTRGLLSFFAHR